MPASAGPEEQRRLGRREEDAEDQDRQRRNDPGTRLERGSRQIVAFAVAPWPRKAVTAAAGSRPSSQLNALFTLLTSGRPQ